MAAFESIPERLRAATVNYQRLTKNLKSLATVEDQLKKAEQDVNDLNAHLRERLVIQRRLRELFARESKNIPSKNDTEAIYWIEKRHNERDNLIQKQIDTIQEKFDASLKTRRELQDSRDQLHMYEAQLAELYSSVFDGENAEFPNEDQIENEVRALNEKLSLIEKPISSYEQSFIHLQQSRNALRFVIAKLQNIYDGIIPLTSSVIADDSSTEGSDYGSTRTSSHSQRKSSHSLGDTYSDSDSATVTYDEFQEILSYIAQAQSHMQQAAALTPRLPDIFTINLVEIMPFKESEFQSGGAGESKSDVKVPHMKIYNAILTLSEHFDTILPNLISQIDEHIKSSKAQLEVVRAQYDAKNASLLAERKRIFDSMLAQIEESSHALEGTTQPRISVSPSSSKAVVVEEGGRHILLSDNQALLLPS